MDNKEINKIISEATNLNWFNQINETISFNHLEISLTFTTISTLHEYLNNQVKGWQKLENLPIDLTQSSANFKRTLEQFEFFITNYINESIESLNSIWANQVQQQLKTLGNPPNFPFDCPETSFLINLNNSQTQYYLPAYQYITGSVSNIMNSVNLKGALLAYEFTTKGKSQITERRKYEAKSINDLKSEFVDYLSKTGKQLTEHLSASEIKYKGYSEEMDLYKTEKQADIDEWYYTNRKKFEAFHETSSQNIEGLEKTYAELLRLKKPAEYWKIRAGILKKEGWQALKWLVGLIGFACLSLYFLLWLTPEGMLLSFISGKASAIKWSIVYVTFISFLVIGIRALSKVMFSSFHLSRDAEEREQLAYFYLALIKDSAIDEKDKHLIMQSLFSRSDTGLLKEDSSPTMPGGIIDKLIQK